MIAADDDALTSNDVDGGENVSIMMMDVGADLVDRIRAAVIGEGAILAGPYGPRRITYADYTASGRSLTFVEDAIRARVLPYYANTHTESSGTGLATTRLREQARLVIRDAVGGSAEHLVIFCGSGVTGAVAKLIGLLDLGVADPAHIQRVADLPAQKSASQEALRLARPVVFVGPYEHHSNELAWREAPVDVVVVPPDRQGRVDPAALDDLVRRYADRPLLVGSFSAGSNVTGIITDTEAVAAVMHRHGGFALFDYAAAGPYLPIRMVESAPGRGDHKDAIFLSPHKFIGGPQTPGVLVVSRGLVRRSVPTVPGGGTIAFVSPYGHRYLEDPVAREEGGTPAIVESIRAGMVFALKQAVGTQRILAAEERLCRAALRRWSANPNLELLGDIEAPRLPIVSFRIRHKGRLLHHAFVVALLNDLFGIQARGGCSCAGPYGHALMHISHGQSNAIDAEVGRGRFGAKPGWARVSFNYFFTDSVADYIVEAVDLVARYGHRLLSEYRFEPGSGLWRHRDRPHQNGSDFSDLLTAPPVPAACLGEGVLADHMRQARVVLASRPDAVPEGPTDLPATFEALRDFYLPPECVLPMA